jgi:hypothetical protein
MVSQNSSASDGSAVLGAAAVLHPRVSTTIAGYTILTPLPESGAEADLYIAENEDHRRYAFKLYRSFTRP